MKIATRASFLIWLLSFTPDIVCLQESHCVSQEELDSWFRYSPYLAYGSFFSPRSAGVIIVISFPAMSLMFIVCRMVAFLNWSWKSVVNCLLSLVFMHQIIILNLTTFWMNLRIFLILEEEQYPQLISDFWNTWRLQKPQYTSPLLWWDLRKRHVKDITIQYCSKRKRQAQAHRESLQQDLSRLQNQVNNGDMSSVPPLQTLKK